MKLHRLSITIASLLAACAKSPDPQDPYQNFNRKIYAFNQQVDNIVLKPVSKAYNTVIPNPMRLGISNAFANLATVPTVANDLLQARFVFAVSDTWRFAINSTVGIVGLFDVASVMGLPRHQTTLSQTLATWKLPEQPYLVLPLLGPATVTDVFTRPIDYRYFSLWPEIHPMWRRNALFAVNFISQRAELLRFEQARSMAALDPYIFDRDAYLQHYHYVLKQNNLPYQEYTTHE